MFRGGADSDILIDMCERTVPHYVQYVFFDTGIEYSATKRHLDFLEQKYNITITRQKAKVPVPLGNKRYGVPFLSKNVSENISRLQRHNFSWEDKPYDELVVLYPRAKSALSWWCNKDGKDGRFNISRNTWLKEFLIKNPPTFQISPKCCDGAKKNTADIYIKEYSPDLMLMGIRKSESVQRASTYHSQLYHSTKHGIRYFLPILFFTISDRQIYETAFNLQHSNCYTQYGLSRTGCVGCPYGREYQRARALVEKYEPKLSKAITNMWQEVYDYTDKYHEFQRIMNLKYKKNKRCKCGCTEFDGDTVAMNLKMINRDGKDLYCKSCLQQILNITDESWNETINNFKQQGCQLF